MKRLRNYWPTIILFLITLLGLFYRLYNLTANYAFWTDEDHVAIFVRAILQRHSPTLSNGYSTGFYQWLWYWLSAIPAAIFGPQEFALRLPAVFFGTATIIMAYYLARLRLSYLASFAATFLTAFLQIEILWSRQARPYQALQFFFLLASYFLYQASRQTRHRQAYLIGFFLTGLAASLCHGLGLLIFINGFFFLLFQPRLRRLALISLLAVLPFIIPFRAPLQSIFLNRFGHFSNLFYYRVFLTHHYFTITLAAISGFFLLYFYRRKYCYLLIIPLAIQLFVVAFLLGQPFTRYFYIVFPYLLILAGANVDLLPKLLRHKISQPASFFISL